MLSPSHLPRSIHLVSYHRRYIPVSQIVSHPHRHNPSDLQVSLCHRPHCHLHKNQITMSRYPTSPLSLRARLLLYRTMSHRVIPHYSLLLPHFRCHHHLYTHHHYQWGAYWRLLDRQLLQGQSQRTTGGILILSSETELIRISTLDVIVNTVESLRLGLSCCFLSPLHWSIVI